MKKYFFFDIDGTLTNIHTGKLVESGLDRHKERAMRIVDVRIAKHRPVLPFAIIWLAILRAGWEGLYAHSTVGVAGLCARHPHARSKEQLFHICSPLTECTHCFILHLP